AVLAGGKDHQGGVFIADEVITGDEQPGLAVEYPAGALVLAGDDPGDRPQRLAVDFLSRKAARRRRGRAEQEGDDEGVQASEQPAPHGRHPGADERGTTSETTEEDRPAIVAVRTLISSR